LFFPAGSVSRRSSLRQALQALVLRGQVIMPTREIQRNIPEPVKLPGKAVHSSNLPTILPF